MGDVGSHSEEEFRECFSLFAKEKNKIAVPADLGKTKLVSPVHTRICLVSVKG